ncbi:MAG TPA: asparagine synthase-related protein, partial [Longimicrobium sp.]
MTAPRLYPAAKRAFDLAAASAGLLVRHVQKLDPRAMLGNGDLKPVLRRLAGGTLPRSVIHRTDKMGFTTP